MTSEHQPSLQPGVSVAAPRSWSVAALLLAANDALAARLGAVTVHGELSGLTRASSGHLYFSLKDADGQAAMLRCAMFRRAASLLDFRPADGLQVEVRGRVAVYEARGELQCVVEAMRPLGAGSLYEQFMRLKARLEAEGLFDATRRRALPRYPGAIGVISSLQAAALRDVLSAIARRAPHVRVVVYPSAVQGDEAPEQLVRAIGLANARAEVDALIVCRGGGSLEDLWAFNDERVVRAVAASATPLVCGVGHETDFTLAELAADLRAPTPTAAAELATPLAGDELAHLDALGERAARAVRRRLDQFAQRTDLLALQFERPARWLAPQAARLHDLAMRSRRAWLDAFADRRAALAGLDQRLSRALPRQLELRTARLDALAARADASDPRRVLARGYAWISEPGGSAVTRGAALRAGDRLVAQWADARAAIEVVSVRPELPLE